MAVTIVDATVTALDTLFRANLPADVPVSVGPPPGGDIPSQYAAVGYGGDDRPSITGMAQPPLDGYSGASAEQFSVWCTISIATGDQLGLAALNTLMTHVLAVLAALRADRTLGGIIPSPGTAELGSYDYIIEEGGAVATVFFQVTVTVRFML